MPLDRQRHMKSTLKPAKEKMFIVILCVAGISCVIYGMTRENDVVFVIGVVLVVSGYLLIRKKLKRAIYNNRP
jgi:hypothetical protein